MHAAFPYVVTGFIFWGDPSDGDPPSVHGFYFLWVTRFYLIFKFYLRTPCLV